MMYEQDMPTAGDYAQASSLQAQRAARSAGKSREALEERVAVLEGQVGFLAKMVQNMIRSLARPAPEDMDTLDRIVHYTPRKGPDLQTTP